MNPTGLFSLTLVLLLLAGMALVGWLIHRLIGQSETHSSVITELQSQLAGTLTKQASLTSDSVNLVSQQMRATLLDCLELQQSMSAGQFKIMLSHQEVLVNRLISKDPIATQALDSRLIATTPMSETTQQYEGWDGSDEDEYFRAKSFALTGERYDNEADETAADLNMAGLT